MIIRKADYNDLDDIYRLMDNIERNTQEEWFFKDDRGYVYNHIEKEGFILVVEDKRIEAYLMVHYVEYDHDVQLSHVVYMDSVGVSESMRGHSLMKRLIIEAENILKNEYTHFLATVHPENLYSLRVLESLGYKKVKVLRKYKNLKRYLMLKSEDYKTKKEDAS